jgi:hypothetical protein
MVPGVAGDQACPCHHVVIDQEHNLAMGLVETGGQGTPFSSVRRHQQRDSPVDHSELFDNAGRGRVVTVDHDDQLSHRRVDEQWQQRVPEVRTATEGRDDHRH